MTACRRLLILDLDGPILDGTSRHHECYRQLLARHGYEALDSQTYWEMKRQPLGLREQLAASGAEAIHDLFRVEWLGLIERPEMLALDRVQPGAVAALERWRDEGVGRLLVTLRRSEPDLRWQLRSLGIDRLFNRVLVCRHEEGGRGKAAAVRAVNCSAEERHFVGDTEVDVEAARELGCPVSVVTCGIRAEAFLRALQPDFICPDLAAVDFRRRHGSS